MKENWKIAQFKDVASVIGGSTPKTDVSEYWGGGNYWVSPAELDGSKYISSTVKTITDLAVAKSNLTLLPAGTVLLSSRAPIGKVAITTVPMYCNQGFKNIVCGPELNNSYVYYFLKHNVAYLQSLGTGATFKEISKKVVETVKISYPSIEEQLRIIDELDLLTSIIDKKNAQLRDLDALAQSIFYEMFGDLMVSEKWPRHIIKDLCIVNPSKKLIPSNLQANDTVSFLPMEDLEIKAGYAEPKQTRLLSEVQGSYTFFAEDDVLLAKVTPCFENGKVGIASNLRNGIGFGSSEFFVIRPIKGIVKEVIYFLAQTQHFISEASKQLTGTSGLRRVPRSFIENLSIATPPMELQEAFAERIKVVEKEKMTIKQSIQSTQTLLDSRMDAYFG